MGSILVVCSGNICRSPVAEGLLRRALERRFGSDAPSVSSAGTIAMDGGAASEGSVVAARELGVDIEEHRARHLTVGLIREADLDLCMAGEHREEIADLAPDAAARAFTLKELVRLLDRVPIAEAMAPDALADRVAEAARVRAAHGSPNPFDDDVVDPLGLPLDTYRAVAWELGEWIDRLVVGLFGPVPVAAEGR
jgi:low molecular weight protein-tyrosine phosphatase